MNNLWFAMDPISSADHPRLHYQLDPNILYHEYNFDKVELVLFTTGLTGCLVQAVLAELQAKGHELSERSVAVSGFIRRNCSTAANWADVLSAPLEDRICVHAVSDKRKGGSPDGF
jgi:gamma-glutamyltranspeptidase